MQLTVAIEKYLTWKSAHTNRAAYSYRPNLKKLVEYFGDIQVAKLRLSNLSEFQVGIRTKYAPSNVSYIVTIVRDFIKFLKSEGETVIDPFMIKVPKFLPKKMPVAEEDHINRMCKYLNDWTYDDLLKKLSLYMMKDTGMRVSELTDLNISDIHKDKNYCVVVTKKNGSERYVMWGKETHEMLLKYLEIRQNLTKTNPLLISYRIKKRITPRSVERWIEILRKKAGILSRLTPHSFRHYKAHTMLANGADVKELQVVLGHSEENPRAAFQYIKLNRNEALSVLKKYTL